jgi:hypothetical protein
LDQKKKKIIFLVYHLFLLITINKSAMKYVDNKRKL